MWGDPEEAMRLDATDSLSMLLFQVASPAHIPYNDPRWQELLHGAEVWVHVEIRDDPEGLLRQACDKMAKNCIHSSNLAALCILVCQKLKELSPKTNATSPSSGNSMNQVAEFSERIAVVGKARAAAGSLQLLRILIHRVLVKYADQPTILGEIFTYRNRDTGKINPNIGNELLDSILQFLLSMTTLTEREEIMFAHNHNNSNVNTNTNTATSNNKPTIVQVPEMYDTAVLALSLLMVMLSTQLYQPMVSSFQQMELEQQGQGQQSTPQQESNTTTTKQTDFFLDLIMEEARARSDLKNQNQDDDQDDNNSSRKKKKRNNNNDKTNWTAKKLLSACLKWQIQRPKSPDRSIARYHYTLAKSVVSAKGEKVGPDGMYESNLVVSAASPAIAANNRRSSFMGGGGDYNTSSSSSLNTGGSHHGFLFDATKGVLVQASTIILLPFRLVSLALGLFHANQNQNGYDRSRKSHYMQTTSQQQQQRRTRDILWITESPIADMSSCLFLLLTNNRRAGDNDNDGDNNSNNNSNPFRMELTNLTDNRWETTMGGLLGEVAGSAMPDLPGPGETISLVDSFEREQQQQQGQQQLTNNPDHHHPSSTLMLNFETLFLSFGAILHTEVGALVMYTILRSSKVFSETLAVRSDLDTVVLPLLRTLYFSSTSRHVSALDFQAKSKTTTTKTTTSEQALGAQENKKGTKAVTKQSTTTPSASLRTMPFRSPSQLYVIVILLLLFSQDSSFGSDAFRRTMVPHVPWYKERYLKDVSLGSVLLLTLLRSLTFNLNRLHDMFLLGNCCAVLMNLANSVVDLHDYAAMRLASVTVSCLKKYTSMTLEQQNNNNKDGENDEGDEEGDTLLDMYAEVSHTLLRLIKHTLVQKNIERNLGVVYALVYHQADFKKIFSMKHTPFKKSETNRIQSVIKASAKIIESKSNARTATKALQVLAENIDQIKEAVAEKKKKNTEKEDFTYSYEEEADPETFFVPYIWEVIVCAVTASSVEWDTNKIQVFPLLEVEEVPSDVVDKASDNNVAPAAFAADIMDVV